MQDERYVVAADLGSSKIALSVAKIEGENCQIVYYRETPSDGIRNGSTFNPKKASDSLKKAVNIAESELNIKIQQIVIGLPRAGIHQEINSAELTRSTPDECISGEEIAALKNMALDTYPLENPEKLEIYGAVAQSFSADDLINQSEDDIIGTISDTIEGNFKIFIGNKKNVSNICKMANLAEIALARQYFVPDAVAKAVLTSEEMDNGVALIEIGAGVTSLTIYHNSILRYYYAIPFGGNNITTDIKFECGFREQLAENIKLGFGSCQPEKLQNLEGKVLQINDDENGFNEHLPIHLLAEIIKARTSEIIETMLWLIQDSGYADKLRNGIVLTGGGANLVGLSDLIKEMSGYKVRIGLPNIRSFSSVCPGIGETSAAMSVGLILKARNDKYLNCIEELASPVETNVKESEDDYSGTVFDTSSNDTSGGVIEKTTPNTKKGEGKSAGTKKISWKNKLESSLGRLFDNSVGNLYDEM